MKKILLLLAIIYSPALFGQCFPDRHSTNWFDAWISCKEKLSPNPVNGSAHWILFDLKNLYLIDKIKIWNINDPDKLNWGMKEIRIEYSEDSLVWNDAGDFTLTKAEGTNRYEGMDWFDVAIPEARYILITGISNFGGSCSGIAEIRFSAEKIEIVTDVEDEVIDVSELQIKILPNPFSDVFRAEFKSESNTPIHIEITDLFGKHLFTELLHPDNGYSSLRVQTRKWSSGAYLMIVRQNEQIIRRQLVKI
jgi:hypothetical protein